MAAYYPIFDDHIKNDTIGPPGIGFKLTNDGNYDMEKRILKNLEDPIDLNDSATKSYVDATKNDLKSKIRVLSDTSLIHDDYFNAKGKRINNLADPVKNNDAASKSYVDSKSLILSQNGNFDGKNKIISNVEQPIQDDDVVNKKYLDYYCIKWDKDKKTYNARSQRISHVKNPIWNNDVVNKIYVDKKTQIKDNDMLKRDNDGLYIDATEFYATIKEEFYDFKTEKAKLVNIYFNMFSSKLLDSNLKLKTDMYMKITIYLNGFKHLDQLSVYLAINSEALVYRNVNINENSITVFAQGKINDTIQFSMQNKSDDNKGKPYLYIKKILF